MGRGSFFGWVRGEWGVGAGGFPAACRFDWYLYFEEFSEKVASNQIMSKLPPQKMFCRSIKEARNFGSDFNLAFGQKIDTT